MNRTTPLKKTCTTTILVMSSLLATLPANGALGPGASGQAQPGLYAAAPAQVVQGADPFVMINLSVELTQQAEAYTGAFQVYPQGTTCPSRDGNGREVCYSGTETYIGYFDPNKCYVYDESGSNTNINQTPEGPYGPNHPTISGFDAHYFKPVGPTDSNHECNGEFSGNFMNWATMTALDEFRAAMTGGARIYDTYSTASSTAQTVLVRTKRFDNWPFVDKRIERSGVTVSGTSPSGSTVTTTFTTNPRRVTPFNTNTLYVVNNFGGNSGHRTRFYNASWSRLSLPSSSTDTFNVMVEVCNPNVSGMTNSLEANCVKYSDGTNTWYKPEGLLQKNSAKMRYALTTYSGRSGNGINGGVLRSNAKYIGPYEVTSSGGLIPNTYTETDSNGLVIYDPDCVTPGRSCTPNTAANTKSSDIVNSGLDTVNSGIINYVNQFALFAGGYKGNDPAAEIYYEGLRYIMGLPSTTSFHSPSTAFSAGEQDGFPIHINWTDPISSANSCQANFALYIGDQFAHRDDYLPGESCGAECSDFQFENPLSMTTPPATILVNADTWTDRVGTLENHFPGTLGNQTRGRGDGYWIAGLAYWANMFDVRPDSMANGVGGKQTVKTFIVDTQEYSSNPPMRQDNQLWLAAKYGGFDDYNGDRDPNDPNSTNPDTPYPEWTSQTGTNPDPDAYTLASQPANLVAGLNAVFNKVLQNSASASAAAVVSNSSNGVATLYEALYEPRLTNGGNAVSWTGILRGLFADAQGRIREDTDQDGKLTGADMVVNYILDPVKNTVTVDLTDPTTNNFVVSKSVRQITPIWDAREFLAALPNSKLTSNRGYTNVATTSEGREIYTWVDLDQNGFVDYSNEWIPFDANTMSGYDNNNSTVDTARFLGLDSNDGNTATVKQLARDLVDYIRGIDKPGLGWRNRTIDIGNGPQTLRLGDIVHAAPAFVGPPSSNYDTAYADDTYLNFKQKYANRRGMVYVGANDGMLHAFNAGFIDKTTSNISTTYGGNKAHDLGAEMWAYVPYNLLPHLRWLADPNYPHIYYVDGTPQVFDVNIFDSGDGIHTGGWGTILVVGFRLGGGDITIDADSDYDGNNTHTMRSAFVVFDVTDPESPPVLLGELTDPNMGFTTSKPVVVKQRASAIGTYAGTTTNSWYLVIGSGPAGSTAATKQAAQNNAISDQSGRLFIYDLADLVSSPTGNNMPGNPSPKRVEGVGVLDTVATTGFVGDLTAIDWNQDYTDDVVYFGTASTVVGSNPLVHTGSLWRLDDLFGSPGVTDMFFTAVNQPFTAKPFPTRDAIGNAWVYMGSGRFLAPSDINLQQQNSYYGLRETPQGGSVNTGTSFRKSTELANTTGTQVFTDGSVNPAGSVTSTSFSNLIQEVGLKRGWYFDFASTSTRFVDRSIGIYGTVVFVDYVASGDACAPLGTSNLYSVNMLTGTASPFAPFGSDPNNTNNGAEASYMSVNLGPGQAFLSGETGDGVMLGTALGENRFEKFNPPGTTGARMYWIEIPL